MSHGGHGLTLGSEDGSQPENMEQFLTAVTKDVDSYWTQVYGTPEQRKDAWNTGFQAGDPSSCGQYLSGA